MKKIFLIFDKQFIIQLTLFSLFILVAGIVSLVLGQDTSDYTISHVLYAPYNLFKNRSMDFLATGSGAMVINPILCIPFYILFVKLNNFPHLAVFLQGIPYGIFCFLVFKLFGCIFKKENIKNRIFVWILFFISVMGSNTINSIGTSQGSLYLLCGELFLVWFLIKKPNKTHLFYLFLSMGIGFLVGSHNSVLGFCIGFLICSYKMLRRDVTGHKILIFTMGFFIGLLINCSISIWYCMNVTGEISSCWMFLWPNGWPFSISPLANSIEFPQNFLAWVLLPFTRISYAPMGYFVDPRLLVGLISSLVLLGRELFVREKNKNPYLGLFIILFLGNYIGWLLLSREGIHSLSLEFWASILFGMFLEWVSDKKEVIVLFLLLACYLLKPSLNMEERKSPSNLVFPLKNIDNLGPNPLVLINGHLSGLIPFLPQHAKYVGGIFAEEWDLPMRQKYFLKDLRPYPKGYYSHKYDGKIKKIILEHNGNIFILTTNDRNNLNINLWNRYGIRINDMEKNCKQIHDSYNTKKRYRLCRVQKYRSTLNEKY